jgi:hypothetical protein
MQTATFIKTIKWLYALEIDDSLDYFRNGFREYLASGRSGIPGRIEDVYSRGIHLNGYVRQIENHKEATALLDAFGLTQIYDADWWQSVVSAFLRVLAVGDDESRQPEALKEIRDALDSLAERMRVLLSCVGPLQQLVVPTSILRLSDFDDVLSVEVHTSKGSEAPTIDRIESVLSSTGELYVTMCRIHGIEEPAPLRMLHMSSESGFRFDFTGDATIVVDLKKLLVDVWIRIRNQDTPHFKDLNRAIVANLGPCHKIEERLASGDLTQETSGQLRHQLCALAMKMFDYGVQIREIPDTDTIDNRQLMDQIRQRRLPAPPKVDGVATPEAALPETAQPRGKKASPKKTQRAGTTTKKKTKSKTATRKRGTTTKR